MLKLQRPLRPNEFEKVSATRINELHFAGFFPEYLDDVWVYLRKSAELTAFLNGKVKQEPATLTSGYLDIAPFTETKIEDWETTTNVDPDADFMIVDLQPEKKERKSTKKTVIEKDGGDVDE